MGLKDGDAYVDRLAGGPGTLCFQDALKETQKEQVMSGVSSVGQAAGTGYLAALQAARHSSAAAKQGPSAEEANEAAGERASEVASASGARLNVVA
jgi:hypothetical protein